MKAVTYQGDFKTIIKIGGTLSFLVPSIFIE